MIRVRLTFVPPGGGEADYGLTMDMPALPREGDYISVVRKGGPDRGPDYLGTEDFIVRRVWWNCEFPEDGKLSHEAGKEPVGVAQAGIECEFAIGPFSSPAHRRGAATPKARTPTKEFDNSAY
jgi:hypothetical protein